MREEILKTLSKQRPQRLLLGFSGELSIKGKGTRQKFVDRLVSNLADALRSHDLSCDIERSWSRLLLHGSDPQIAEVASRVFGVQSVTLVEQRSWRTLDDILCQGQEILAPHVQGKTFAVKVKRGEAAQKHPFKSPEVERRLGELLFPHAAGVDLKRPEAPVSVEIRGQEVYFGGGRRIAHGGLPIGTEGKALALISGGFDSAVAAWRMLRRGVRLDYLFLNLGGDGHCASVLRVLDRLAKTWSYGSRPRVHMVDFRPHAEEIQRCCPAGLWQVVLKRQMLRAADQVARMYGLPALVTGEAIGQVSSQTLQNLAVIAAATRLPIIRPLATEPKEDIVASARRIGTYALSEKVPEYCALAGKNPQSHASPRRVAASEQRLDLEALGRSVESRAIFDLRALDLDLIATAGGELEEVPEGAAVIDLRSAHAFRSWSYPGAEHVDYGDAVRDPARFDADRVYLFYCEVGLKSAQLAESLSRRGLVAYHLRGGLRQAMRLAEGGDPLLRALRSPALLD